MSTPVELTVRCAPWKDGRSDSHPVAVDLGEDPRVRVWDPIGKIFTVCHVLSERAQARIIAQARKAVG